LQIGFRVPYSLNSNNSQWQYYDAGLQTSGDFMEGQKTVIGKMSGSDDETSIFVVIALKVLD
jgi:hypothetical protein